MKIQEKDRFHGSALTQIVEHDSFKALNKAPSKKYGHYLINTDRHIFIKYRTTKRSPYIFQLQPDEISSIANVMSSSKSVFLCLVCGNETVCALDCSEIALVIDLNSASSQSIRVEIPSGGSCRVSGSNGKLKKTVTHNSFPEKVFA